MGKYIVPTLLFPSLFLLKTSVDWEKTGTRTSVSAGKRKLEMSTTTTTTTLNVNTNVKL